MKKQTKQVKKTNKRHESGRSMIEMVGVLAVMGLITAAAFVLITSAMSSQRISRIDDDMSAIVQGVRLLYNPSDNFAGIAGTDSGKSVLQVLGFKDTKNPYGGSYALNSSDTATTCDANTGACTVGTSPDAARFTITVDNMGNAVCTSLAGRNWPGGGIVQKGSGETDCTKGTTGNKVVIQYGKTDRTLNQ